MPWAHLVWIVRSLVEGAERVGDGASVHQDLFGLADATAALLAAPVTIEDARHRVLAYSTTTDTADPARTSTIVGRAVPDDVVRHFRALGVFRTLATTTEPFQVPASDVGVLPRLVIPVRVGDELLGSVWAIWSGELTAALCGQLQRSAAAIALHLLQLRAQGTLASRYSIDLVRRVLAGTPAPDDPVPTLPAGPWRVVAFAPLGSGPAHEDLDLWRTTFRRHAWADPILADLDGVLLGVVSERSGPGSWPWLQRLLAAGTARAAAGAPVEQVAALPRSRTEALHTLAELRDTDARTLAHEEVWAPILLRRSVAWCADEPAPAALEALAAHDTTHGSDLSRTLLAWLDHWGDVTRTGRALGVHPNTVRHRLGRVRSVVGDEPLEDPRQRQALHLVLLGRSWGQGAGTT